MKGETRSRIADGLDRAHLLRPAERLREEWLVRRVSDRRGCGPDGIPLPPPRLRLLVAGRSADSGPYLQAGRQMFAGIRGGVGAMGREVEELGAVLDFGCGCGRVARHWASVPGPELHGCDYNAELVDWCARNLCSLRAIRNQPAPPLPYVSGSFDLVYALSVFTHLDDALQREWLDEFRRILAPGGLLVVSVLGASVADRLGAAERRRFEAGEMVAQRPRFAGRNLCSVYHPRAYVEGTLMAGWDDVRQFDLGSPELPIWQTAYIARRAASTAAGISRSS
jgi:SAM-dependent methyltransferase